MKFIENAINEFKELKDQKDNLMGMLMAITDTLINQSDLDDDFIYLHMKLSKSHHLFFIQEAINILSNKSSPCHKREFRINYLRSRINPASWKRHMLYDEQKFKV